jgi:predicted phage tail protein
MKKLKIIASTVFVLSVIFNFVDLILNNNINTTNIQIYKAEGAILTAIITTIITTAISYIIAPKPKAPRFSSQDEAKGTLVNKDSNNNPIPVVYGKRQVGLTRVFVESSGTDNQYLYVAGVLCEGGGAGITAIDEVYVDDKLVTFDGALTNGTLRGVSSGDTNFYKGGESLISIQGFFGLDNQSASSLLDETTNWTSNHKLSGLAYVALRFKWNQDAFNGLPEVRVTVRGKKIYDPRLDSTKGGSGSHRQDDPTTWAYSANSSLVLLDYLRNSRYGKGLPNDAFETNYDSFKTSANTCDTQVTPYSGAVSDINLFETNAVIDSEKKVLENVRELLVPMRAIFNYTQGKYKVIIEGTGSSQLLLTKDNVVSEVKLQGESKSEKYNRVIGTFTNPEKDYQSDTVSYPPFDDSGLAVEDQHATMLSDDNNTLLERSFDMLQVTSPYQAEEICENILKRSRNNLKAEVTVTSEALNLSIGDIVTATYETAGFSAKPFRVMSLAINSDSTVTLGLEEHQDNFYSWEEKGEAPTIADTVLPNPFSVQPPASITLDDDLIEYNDGTCITRLTVSLTASPDAFVDQYEVEVKQTLDADGNAVTDDYRVIGRGIALNYELLNAIDGATYSVRARAINTLGVRSTYTTATRLIIGATATPSDVSAFNLSIIGSNQMELSWIPVQDLDIEFYEIRYQKVSTGAVWNNSTNLVKVPRRKSNSKTVNIIEPPFALMIKAVDKLGNESAEPATIYSNVSRLENFESIGVITE